MLESEVQSRLIKRLKREGWLVCKQNLTSITGWPDLLCIKEGRVIFVEVKRPGEKPRALQEYCHTSIRNHGGTVVVYDGGDLPHELTYE